MQLNYDYYYLSHSTCSCNKQIICECRLFSFAKHWINEIMKKKKPHTQSKKKQQQKIGHNFRWMQRTRKENFVTAIAYGRYIHNHSFSQSLFFDTFLLQFFLDLYTLARIWTKSFIKTRWHQNSFVKRCVAFGWFSFEFF